MEEVSLKRIPRKKGSIGKERGKRKVRKREELSQFIKNNSRQPCRQCMWVMYGIMHSINASALSQSSSHESR